MRPRRWGRITYTVFARYERGPSPQYYFGDMVLTEDVEEQTVSLRPASEESSGFDVVAWLVSRNSTFMKDAESWLEVTANMGPLNGVRKEVEVKYADLIKYYWDGSAKELFEHDADLNGLRYLVTGVRGFLDQVYRVSHFV